MELEIRKLQTEQERFDAERLLATSFLHTWNEEDARKSAREPLGDVWAAYGPSGRMVSAISTVDHRMAFEGKIISCGEAHMVGTLPEARGTGAVRAMMARLLREYRSRGDLFATLIPFSFAFYRKFGFESASTLLKQKAAIDQFASFRQEFASRQIASQEDVDSARKLYEAFALRYSLAVMRPDADWTYRGNGEFGERDWEHADKQPYSYLFTDAQGAPRAYFTFVFVPGPEGPFTGAMAITDLVFDGPEALRSVFGFFHAMRAKITHVEMETPTDLDLSLLLPECGKVERRLEGYMMARALNAREVLSALRYGDVSGSFSVHVEDGFLPENTGSYAVDVESGKAVSVTQFDGSADLDLIAETFCQLAIGRIDLPAALYRGGTVLHGNEDLLRRVFVKKPLLLR